MNKTYKVVYNHHTQTYTAVQETAKSRGKSTTQIQTAVSDSPASTQSRFGFKLTALTAVLGSLLLMNSPAMAAAYINVNSGTGPSTTLGTDTTNATSDPASGDFGGA